MAKDFFTFLPQFKLLIAGNHKPGLRNVDEAMRRRFHLVPFNATIPQAERDPNLPEKLKAEWPGIMKWMIVGCLEWQKVGLNPPAAVTEVTTEYFEDEDSFAAWLAESVVHKVGASETSADLFSNWKSWAERAGEEPGNRKRFAEQMQTRGFAREKGHAGKRRFGSIQLIKPFAPTVVVNYEREAHGGG